MQGDAARQKMGTEGKPEHDGPGQGQGKRRKAWRAKVRKARIKASERQGHWPGKRMVEVVWSGREREGSHGWGAGLRGRGRAGQGTWQRGQDPQGRAADLPGVLRSRVRGGHSLQTKRGRSSAERGGTGWPGGLGGQDGWPGRLGGLGVRSPVGTAPRARCWGKGRKALIGRGAWPSPHLAGNQALSAASSHAPHPAGNGGRRSWQLAGTSGGPLWLGKSWDRGRQGSDFPVAQMVKNLPVMQKPWVPSLGREDPLEKGVTIHPSILAWRIPRTEEPGGLQSVVSQRVRHD